MLWSSARFYAQKATATAVPSPAHSRLAAASIRQLIANHDLPSAYLALNSLRISCADENAKLPGVSHGFRKQRALKFGRPISPRLAYHSLLHALIRLGLQKQAYKLAAQMLPEYSLRAKSYEALIRSLLPSPHDPLLPSKYTREDLIEMEKLCSKEFATKFKPTSSNPGTRLALFLLFNNHILPSTKAVNDVLVACLDQGNVVVASLLVTKLLENSPPPSTSITPSLRPKQGSRAMHDIVTPYLVRRILAVIDTMLSSEADTKGGDIIRHHAVQALANLATLLKDRKFPFLNVSTIIRSMGRCPRLDKKVWIRSSDGETRSIKVYGYLHDILKELCSNPTSRNPSGELVHVGLNTYNSLLHYALFSRRSLPLSRKIITHMTQVRDPPLEPSVVTSNILVRGATMMQKNEVATNALAALYFGPGNMPLTSHQMVLQRLVNIARTQTSYSQGLYSNRIPASVGPRLARETLKAGRLSTKFSNPNFLWLTRYLHRLQASWQMQLQTKSKHAHFSFRPQSGVTAPDMQLSIFWLEMVMAFIRYSSMESSRMRRGFSVAAEERKDNRRNLESESIPPPQIESIS